MESQGDGPSPTVLSSPGGIRDESILELAPRKPALNELPSPTQGQTSTCQQQSFKWGKLELVKLCISLVSFACEISMCV